MLMSNLIFCLYSCFLQDPAIRILFVRVHYPITTHSALLLGGAMTDQFLHIAGSRKELEGEKMRFDISTCEFLLEVHVLMSNLIFSPSSSFLDPAIRLCTLNLPDNNSLRLIAGCGNG